MINNNTADARATAAILTRLANRAEREGRSELAAQYESGFELVKADYQRRIA